MYDLYYIAGVLAIVILGAIYLPKLKKSGILKEENIEDAIKTLSIIELILNSVDATKAFQNKSKFICDLSYDVVDMIGALATSNEDKAEVSLGIVKEILEKLQINISEPEQRLIDMAIRDGLNALEN